MSSFIQEVAEALGDAAVSDNRQTLDRFESNSLGLTRRVKAVVCPSSAEDVVSVVRLAQAHSVPLYPISCGKNLGYGDATPVVDDQVVLDLSRMNRIREINHEQSYVIVEPGVTQLQLYQALQEFDSPMIADMTGAGHFASIVGNTLEGGFGHTPIGNHRLTSSDFEVVLGSGELFKTGAFPGPGPDLAGVFIQSNFGIVTAMRVELMRKPESFVSFMAECRSQQDIEPFFQELSLLRKEGVLSSLVHVANALRSYMTLKSCPEQFDSRVMSNEDARGLMGTKFLRIGDWTAIGGLYGSKGMTSARAKLVRKRLGRFGAVRFMTDFRLQTIEWLLRRTPLSGIASAKEIASSLAMYRPLHDLMQGVPSEVPLQHISWREAERKDMGLIWCAPVASTKVGVLSDLLEVANRLFASNGFEMPVTVTLIDGGTVVCTLSIHFDRRDTAATEKAHALYLALLEAWSEKGILPYRQSLLAFDSMKSYYSEEKRQVLCKLKQCFDPHNILSRGRYGIEL